MVMPPGLRKQETAANIWRYFLYMFAFMAQSYHNNSFTGMKKMCIFPIRLFLEGAFFNFTVLFLTNPLLYGTVRHLSQRSLCMKNILFVASECGPFVKTGGLGDVVGSLPQAIDKSSYDVRVIIPQYGAIAKKYRDMMHSVCYFQMDGRIYVGINTLSLNGITYYFVDNKQYFSGAVPYYDMFQDLERFAYFDKAVLSALPLIGFRPDILHCHDWQASLVPVYLNTIFQGNQFYRGIRTVMTIHNIRFQGTWDVGHIRWVSGLPNECFQPGKLVSPFQDTTLSQSSWNCSMLRGGLVYSDYITTVSNSYAKEIQTTQFGNGLNDILYCRQQRLWGIINGIDYNQWSPEKDGDIAFRYDKKNCSAGKRMNKEALYKELHLPGRDRFTLGLVGRLTDQKGLDLIGVVIDELCRENDTDLVVLGTGDHRYEDMFHYYEEKYPDRVSANIGYSESLAHRIYAGADAFLVPSAFEPCGLTQLIALRYGTVPIVHETGGLKDTVEPYNEYAETGTGFTFHDYTGWALMDRINHARAVYYDRPASWNMIQWRGMSEDWSWKNSSKIYEQLYSEM